MPNKWQVWISRFPFILVLVQATFLWELLEMREAEKKLLRWERRLRERFYLCKLHQNTMGRYMLTMILKWRHLYSLTLDTLNM